MYKPYLLPFLYLYPSPQKYETSPSSSSSDSQSAQLAGLRVLVLMVTLAGGASSSESESISRPAKALVIVTTMDLTKALSRALTSRSKTSLRVLPVLRTHSLSKWLPFMPHLRHITLGQQTLPLTSRMLWPAHTCADSPASLQTLQNMGFSTFLLLETRRDMLLLLLVGWFSLKRDEIYRPFVLKKDVQFYTF